MWNRTCPLCYVKLSRLLVLSRSNDLVCPTCHAQLELSRPSRFLASVLGIAAAMLAFHLARTSPSIARSVIPIPAAILAFGFASALTLFFLSDLVVRPHPHAATFPHAHT